MLVCYLVAQIRTLHNRQQVKMLRARIERIDKFQEECRIDKFQEECGIIVQHLENTKKELRTLLAQIN